MTFEKVKKIIAEQLSIDENEINMDSNIKDGLGVDSLDIFEIIMSLEDEFNIEVPNEDIENMNTVQDVVKYVDSKVK